MYCVLVQSPYLDIVDDIKRRIASGELKPGDRLPPVRQVARQWGGGSGDRHEGHEHPAAAGGRPGQAARGHGRGLARLGTPARTPAGDGAVT
ncbi:hypothetical protein GCM10018965_065420 [Nonomuraea roseola]